MTVRVVWTTVRLLWVMYRLVVSLVAAVVGAGGAGDVAPGVVVLQLVGGDGQGEQSCPWTAGRPRPVMVVLVVSTLRLLEMPGSSCCAG